MVPTDRLDLFSSDCESVPSAGREWRQSSITL